MKICFLTRSLETGGLQSQLFVLAKGLIERGHQVSILALYTGGNLERFACVQNLRVRVLRKKGRWHLISFFRSLLSALKGEKPDILQSFLTAGNILSVMVKPFLRGLPVVWGLRASNMDLRQYHWFVRFSSGLEKRLSRFADCVIANSRAGVDYAIQNGFPPSRITVVFNGIDTERFKRDQEGRTAVRQEWGVRTGQKLIGLVARLDPMKDHRTFLEAAAAFQQEYPEARFVCVGPAVSDYTARLKTWTTDPGLKENVIWAGTRMDMPQVYSAFDLATSTSCWGEGFSNAIGEAMSCETPCVATDVGDSAMIVGDCGIVVPPGGPERIAQAWAEALQGDRNETGRRARLRIIENFGLDRMIAAYEEIYVRMTEEEP